MDAAIKHCTAGIGIWEWASNDKDGEPDVVMACAGDVPTLETLAAVHLLRRTMPDLKIRFINVVDLMTLQPPRSIRTVCRRRISMRSSPPTSRSYSPITAIPG